MKVIYFLLFALLTSVQAFSQAASASVTSRATVVEPIQIEKTLDLDFGNVIASYNPGSVILSPDGTRTAIGVQISSAVPGKVNPAEAIVSHSDLSYSISLPESFTLYNQEDPNKMLIIDQFTVTPEPLLISQGSDLIKIGATLNLQADQDAGFYTNSTGFSVTVSYN